MYCFRLRRRVAADLIDGHDDRAGAIEVESAEIVLPCMGQSTGTSTADPRNGRATGSSSARQMLWVSLETATSRIQPSRGRRA
jgi:hypothetical protein